MYYDKHIEALGTENYEKSVKLNVAAGGILHGVRTVEDMDNVATLLAGKIGNEVLNFRTKIIPKIRDIKEIVETMTERSKRELVVHAPDIVRYGVPEWFNGLLDKGIIENYEPSQYLPGEVTSFPKPKLFSTLIDTSRYDDAVLDFIHRLSHSNYERVWDLYLLDVTKNNENILDLFNRKKITKENQFDIFILLLLLIELDAELPAGTMGTLGDVRSNIKSLRQHIIIYLSKEDEFLRTTSAVMLTSNVKNNIIVVNSLLYKSLLEKTNVDTLYGAFYNAVDIMSGEELLANSSNFKDRWEQEHRKININITNASETIYRSAYIYAIDDMLKSMPADKALELRVQIRDYINSKNSDELSNIITSLEDIYGGIIYKSTNLEFFLKEVRRFGKGTDRETAVTYAIASMLSVFLSSQISKYQ